MPSASRIFSRNQYAPVIFWEAVNLRGMLRFAMADSGGNERLAFMHWSSSIGA